MVHKVAKIMWNYNFIYRQKRKVLIRETHAQSYQQKYKINELKMFNVIYRRSR